MDMIISINLSILSKAFLCLGFRDQQNTTPTLTPVWLISKHRGRDDHHRSFS